MNILIALMALYIECKELVNSFGQECMVDTFRTQVVLMDGPPFRNAYRS
jgi:hypothetical protein